jgi:hypothetical protein
MVCDKTKTICSNHLFFEGVSSYNEDLLLNIVEANFKTFFDWSFLHIGAWFDATIDEYTIYSSGFSPAQLKSSSDEFYDDGQVWQGMRKDWVYETGCFVESEEYGPIAISGLYIDDIFHEYPSSNFYINYSDGRVVFNDPIPVDSEIKLNYSYRSVQVYRASDAPWFSMIQYNTLNDSNVDIQRTEDGDWSIAGNHKIQLPAIVIDPISRSQSRPYEIGSNELIMEQDIGFYVLAENKNDRNKLLDILRLQQGITIDLYNTSTVAQNNHYPINYQGDINPSGMMYPEIVSNYHWRTCFLKNLSLFEIESVNPNFHQGLVRATLEIIS